MLNLVKQHKKKALVSLPLVAVLSYYGARKLYNSNKKTIVNAPHMQQNPELPRGCEVTSLAMLLRHAGIAADKMELANKLDKVPFEENGLQGNMQEGFAGDMYSFSRPGLGVYVNPIYKLGFSYLKDQLVNLTGGEPQDLYHMIDRGAPVWSIVNDTFAMLPEERFEIWFTSDGPMHVTYALHSVLLTGYSQNYVYINDPLHETPNRRIKRKDFEQAWIQLGRQALSYKTKQKQTQGQPKENIVVS
ncbi:C39 family peptidase [Ectobacillus panaciterrae]|uniref:C39 family peptidase n=1 Tax=Ectobacillus panaciterrae TaxID=363872 RepID=UPI00040002A2|nr:C39 family peptidase [Ectobacillus panaciterrae]